MPPRHLSLGEPCSPCRSNVLLVINHKSVRVLVEVLGRIYREGERAFGQPLASQPSCRFRACPHGAPQARATLQILNGAKKSAPRPQLHQKSLSLWKDTFLTLWVRKPLLPKCPFWRRETSLGISSRYKGLALLQAGLDARCTSRTRN